MGLRGGILMQRECSDGWMKCGSINWGGKRLIFRGFTIGDMEALVTGRRRFKVFFSSYGLHL
jgi:hypothetical protein